MNAKLLIFTTALIAALITTPALTQLRPSEIEALKQIEAREKAEQATRDTKKAEQAKAVHDYVNPGYEAQKMSDKCSFNPYLKECKR